MWIPIHGKAVFILERGPHYDVIKCKHFPRYWSFVRGIHRSPVNSLHKGQWRGALMFSSICVGINGWENNHEAGDLIRYRARYDVIVMLKSLLVINMAPCSSIVSSIMTADDLATQAVMVSAVTFRGDARRNRTFLSSLVQVIVPKISDF